METKNADILIVGTGASVLCAALHIPENLQVLMIDTVQVKASASVL